MPRRPRSRRGFTLADLLLTAVLLALAGGLMLSLARRVRSQSANELTRNVLARVDAIVGQYQIRLGTLPTAVPLSVLASADLASSNGPRDMDSLSLETQLLPDAKANAQAWAAALLTQSLIERGTFEDLPSSTFDGRTVYDAWGSPIVLMPAFHAAIGMSRRDRYFLFSAGPDRRYLTRADNLYSYDGLDEPATPAR